MQYNIYVDESCHIEKDGSPVMCIGYTKVGMDSCERIKTEIKNIKKEFKTPVELKWNSISKSRIELYKKLIDYFFQNPIDFRCILVKYKEKLDHNQFNQGSHDNFYYKLVYFLLTNSNFNPLKDQYRVFLDIKDTRSSEKLIKIQKIIRGKTNNHSPFILFQHVRSEENVFIQLTDIFIGAITYKNRNEHTKSLANPAKIELINYIESKSGYSLEEGTEPWETKFNIFDHQPKSMR